MTWTFNFCSPTIPNDPVIELNRNLQIGSLFAFMFIYVLIHIYYVFCGPQPLEEKENISQENQETKQKVNQEKNENKKQEKLSSPEGSVNNDAGSDENSSYVTFNKAKTSYKNLTKSLGKSKKAIYIVVENMTIQEIQNYFPLVFGHYSIIVAQSVLYSPYFIQTLMIMIYGLLAIILLILNAKRKKILLRIIYGIMSLLLLYVSVTAMVEIAQTNYDAKLNECFSRMYKQD